MKWNLEFVDGSAGIKYVVSVGVKDGVEVDRVILGRYVMASSADGGWKEETL